MNASRVLRSRIAWVLLLPLAGLFVAACRPPAGASRESAGAGTAVSIRNIGSDTLVNLALAWAEAYMQRHPEVRISVTGGGSGTGITALINRTTDIANASRRMSPEELAEARRNGIDPLEHPVALDAIAVVVNPSNPVSRLSLRQISSIYTARLKRWTELGGEDRPIVLLSRESNSGTYVYFLEQVVRLGKKDGKELFSPETLLMPSSEGISNEIRRNPNAIGYDGLGYVTRDQKTIAVAAAERGPWVLPSAETVLNGSYPISRPLFMYTAGRPSQPVADYLAWIEGGGQRLVKDLGFVPLQAGEGPR